jgi:hypothetical protein
MEDEIVNLFSGGAMRMAYWVLLGLCWMPIAMAEESKPFHGSEAFFDFRLSGHEMIDERVLDINGDGMLDDVVVEQSEEGIGLSAWKAEPEGGYTLISRSAKVPASILELFVPISLNASDDGFLLDVVDDCPDEADHWVRIFVVRPIGIEQVLEARYRVTHPEEEAGRIPFKSVEFGPSKTGLEIVSCQESWPRVLIRHDPKQLIMKSQGDEEVHITIGIWEKTHLSENGVYREVKDHYLDFLPRVPVKEPENPTPESILLKLERPAKVRMVRVVPGCATDEKSWNQKPRATRFTLQFDGGVSARVDRTNPEQLDPNLEAFSDFVLPDPLHGVQTLVFLKKEIETRSVSLTIDAWEKGVDPNANACFPEVSVHEGKTISGSM